MKKLSVAVMAVLLAACGTSGSDQHIDALRKPVHLRTERNLGMTFPEIQMALFKHQEACGSAPVFRMKEGETSYATVSEADSADLAWNQKILFDLMWLQPTWRYESRTRVYVYSFYSDASVKQRIDAIFAAIEDPQTCSAPADAPSAEKT